MLEKSLGILFYLKKTKNSKKGLVPIYLRKKEFRFGSSNIQQCFNI